MPNNYACASASRPKNTPTLPELCCHQPTADTIEPRARRFRLLSTEAVNKYTALSSVEATEGGMPALRDK
eukprot:2055129-Prymnesium_polylepis.1